MRLSRVGGGTDPEKPSNLWCYNQGIMSVLIPAE